MNPLVFLAALAASGWTLAAVLYVLVGRRLDRVTVWLQTTHREVARIHRQTRKRLVPDTRLDLTVPGRAADWSDDDIATRVRP